LADISNNAFRRIRNVTRYWETVPRNHVERPTAPRLGAFGFKGATSTTSISANSGSTPGTGTATLDDMGDTSFSSSGISVTVYNRTEKTIASGSKMLVGLVDGKWFVLLVEKCSNLS
jgi:hypothetical protein